MSAPRDDSVYLSHLRDAITRVASYLDGVDEALFFETPLFQDGVTRQLEIIGEAAKHLSGAFRSAHPGIPWRQIIGMRSKLIHDYMHVNLQAVWDTATLDLPKLRVQLFPPAVDEPGSNGG